MSARSVPAPRVSELAEVAERVTRDLIALPLDYVDTVTSIVALLRHDHLNIDHLRAVVAAIVTSAMADPFRETTANRFRPLVPGWVRRGSMTGATVMLMVRAGLLVPTGRWIACTNTAARNSGKPQPVYALDLAALRDHTDTT